MQPPLRPIRPALSLLRLLCLALVLFPSFADHFGGASSVKGVLAAPASPNLPPTRDGVLPAAPASPNLLPTRDGVLPAAPASSNLPPTSDNVLPAAPARSPNQIPHSDSDGPVEVEFYLFRRDRSTGKRQEGKPSSPTENWQGRVGELFTFKRDKRGISVTYGKELEDFAKERHARVALRVGGQPLGKITFKSRTAMKESSGRVTKDLGTSYGQRRGLLFITHGIDLLEKEKDVTVEMDREYYVLDSSPSQVDSDEPVEVADNKEKRLSHRTKSGKGKWENCLLSQFERVLKGIFVTYGKELEDFAKQRHANVGLRAGGQLLGQITVKSRTAMKESSRRVTEALETAYEQHRGLLFLEYGISLLKKEKDVKVEMDRKYSVLVRDMLRKMGTGDGHEVPESDTAWRYLYADMEAGLTLMLDWGWSEEDLALMRSLVASQVAQSEKE
ncbi:hypothetical protein EV361DRAFT_975529 [Lentinula raphanica]|nr:hypothetical protein EV361DRAFT_975529 [Lentinula raphanica]